MPSKEDLERGAEAVRRLHEELERQGDNKHRDKLQALLSLLESPVFGQILQLQASVKKLKKKVNEGDFDPENINFLNPPKSDSSSSSEDSEEEEQSIEEFVRKSAQGRETEEIELYKAENEGLGFSVVGLRSENRGDLGIFVQDIKPDGVADRHGGLKERDQILVIDGQPLAPNISHEAAIGILQKVKGTVRLVVARGGIPQMQGTQSSISPQVSRTPSAVSSLSQASGILPDTKWAEVETIELHNDGCGLGFGIVGGQATGGVVVKTIVDGGAAQKNGRLRSGDHILRISDTDVREMSSEQAAQILRQCGTIVKLVVARGALDDIADRNNDFLENQDHSEGNDANTSSSDEEEKDGALEGRDMNFFDVVLEKDAKGLGITIAGFVDDDETDDESASRIYVKSVLPGSAASKDGRIRPRDQIVAVDGRSLMDPHITSDDAVNVLRSTSKVVKLTIGRPNKPAMDMTTTDMQTETSMSSSSESEDEDIKGQETTEAEDEISYSLPLSPDVEDLIKRKWQNLVGNQFTVVVAQIHKFSESSGLGISLEGTVDMSDHPHHYVRSILHDGPVGINGVLRPGDELLEVNGHPLLGLNHVEVVVVMKELPIGVVMVCARPLDALVKAQARDSVVLEEFDGEFQRVPESDIAEETEDQTSQTQTSSSDEDEAPTATDDRSTPEPVSVVNTDDVRESESSITEAEDTDVHDELPNAAWDDEIHYVELNKGDRGLGFSILDFQDPIYPDKTALLIRSLVKGGESDMSGKLHPGEKLVSVNQVSLEGSNLQTAVTVLKALPKGIVVLGLRKPKSMYKVHAETSDLSTRDEASSDSSDNEADESEQSQNYADESHHIHEPSPVPSPHIQQHPDYTSQSQTEDATTTQPSSSSSSESEEEDDSSKVPSVSSVIAAFNKGGYHKSESEAAQTSSTEKASTDHGSASYSEVSETETEKADDEAPSSLPVSEDEKRSDRTMEIKQIPVAGMTAIAITSSSMQRSPREIEPEPQEPQPLYQPPPQQPKTTLPSPKQKFSAPSWQDSGSHQSRPLPEGGYERTVYIEKGNTSLGVTVSPDKEGDGLIIRSILAGGAISRTGEPQVGDIIRRVNSDSAVGLGSTQARSLIRNHSLHSSKVKIVYIPKANIHAFKNGLEPPMEGSLQSRTSVSSTSSDHESIASMKTKFENKDEVPVKPTQPSYDAKPQPVVQPQAAFHHVNAPKKRTKSPVNTAWGPVERIEIKRSPGVSLGISIVGGANNNPSSGKPQEIYIKDVIPSSTVGTDGRIKPGDRILKVNETDLVGATHAQAVEAIRSSGKNIVLWVQSYVGEKKQIVEPARSTPVDPRQKYANFDGQIIVVDLEKGPKGLGLSLAGNKDEQNQGIFVVGINPDGAAGRDGRIQVGDEICEINGVSLNSPNNHQTAISVISAAKSTLQIVLLRSSNRQATPEPEQGYEKPQADVKVIKLVKDFQGLGFAIKETPRGIVVQSLAAGGTADRDGQLKKGDYILAVNDHILKDVSYEMAINILKSTKGVVSLTVAPSPQTIDSEEEDALTCPIVDGREVTIEIIKGKSGLGLSIVGGSDSLLNSILVHTVYDNGAAAKDGRLWPGDQILKVNNKDLHNATHEEAIEALRHTPSRVRLTVLRDTSRDSVGINDDPMDYIDVVLEKPPGRGLGLTIVGKRDDVGVFVSDVLQGGVAYSEGTIRKGDQIVEVDGISIEHSSQKDAAMVLKNIGDTVQLRMGRAKVNSGGAVTSLFSPPATLEREKSNNSSSLTTADDKDVKFIEIEKSPTQPLGISISGGIGSPLGNVPIFVAMVQNHGAATNKLKVGDKILSINGQSTEFKTHDEVVQMLRGPEDAIVLMKVQEGGEDIKRLTDYLSETANAMNKMMLEENSTESEMLNKNANQNVDLSKCIDLLLYRGNEGFGFTIVGGFGSTYGDLPIFVKSISPTGPAAENGKLKKGDRIVSVNGELLTNATHDEALQVLKSAKGRVMLRIMPA